MTERVSRRPVVLIPARFSASASALRYRAEVTALRVVESVYAAGAEPVTIHPQVPEGRSEPDLDGLVRARIGMADGLLLPGGGDVSPRWSGQEVHPSQYDVDEVQDAFDLALARVALADGIALLSICRGTQIVNVARGGDLIQDLSADHRPKVHKVALGQDFPLGGDSMRVSCYHHQGLGRLGRGMRAVAHAEDGTIEAVTLDRHHGWYFGVQWHPEDTADEDPLQAGIFEMLVQSAKRSRRPWLRWR
jgi:putative glutamine amidotransferase